MTAAPHISVLLREVIEAVRPAVGQLVVDGTFGAGGYTRAFLERGARVVAFDRDPSVAPFAAALKAEYGDRFDLVPRCFSELEAGLEGLGLSSPDAVVLDIGVSSMQLDQAERGFSFMRDGPLDMRMGDEGQTAADLVNELDPDSLANILYVYGEERQSRRVASFIARRREETPFSRTLDLASVIEKALGGRKGDKAHPATRAFQALRIAVNDELGELERAMHAAEALLPEGGRLAIVTFHSLEDRMVKAFFAARAGKLSSGSRHLPPTAKGPEASFTLPKGGAIAPADDELDANPRARSAKLRVGVRTAVPANLDTLSVAPEVPQGNPRAFKRGKRG